MAKSIEVAKIDAKTGNPLYEDGKLVKHRVDPDTGAEVKGPAKAKVKKTSGKKKKAGSPPPDEAAAKAKDPGGSK